MRKIKIAIFIAKIGLLLLVIAAGASEAKAGAFSDYLVHRYRDKIDRAFDKMEYWAREFGYRYRGEVHFIAPRRAAAHSPSCGHLPDSTSTSCCMDNKSRMVIKYYGPTNPYEGKVKYEIICLLR